MYAFIPSLFVLLALCACAGPHADGSAGPPAKVSNAMPPVPAGSEDDGIDRIADALFKQRDFALTIRLASVALAADAGTDPAARRRRGRLYLARGAAYYYLDRLSEALKDLGASVRERPDFHLTFFFIGRVADASGQHDDALEAYTLAIGLDSSFADSFYFRGLGRARKRDFDGAIADFSRAIRLRPNFASAHAYRGLVYAMAGEREAAAADYRRALTIDPGDRTASTGLERLALPRRESASPVLRAPRRSEPPLVEF